ncbi:MBL fold metallo-hydrolase [Parvularcula sp. ZS-1/3]|uniref:MBL fold metallo-hydrolase n=1 Tax=Parvularcula mediterranea TaxID=2732508 RepID=A0A7Y3RN34_9PROT|nr:MBL fold metallo-hydrolase [Parvularcula mediterranea]NNU17059.1 MBL fold metallo-hydrolase [Parvularcula mediterranea]
MILKTIKTDGLAHLSYFLGDGNEAAVIDPRRDIEIYIEEARKRGMRITHIFETHRNEDLVSGAPILAEATGANVHHGPNPAGVVSYAETTREGDRFEIGSATIEVLETPGHTDDSLSFVLYDQSFDDGPVGVFTGDALFVGDVGRTDFYPDRAREVAGLLYDSLQKLVGLGDQALLYPAHGAGSVCGSGMADREFSSIGHERRNNPRLQFDDREAFIEAKLAEEHPTPPYFSLMEKLNLEGASAMRRYLLPDPVSPGALQENGKTQLVDIRGIADFLGAHAPGSFCIPDDMLAAFAGWLLDPGGEVLLISRNAQQAEAAVRTLGRIGFDHVTGFLPGIMPVAASGNPFRSVGVVDTQTVKSRLGSDGWTLLDVRSAEEFDAGHIEGAQNVYLGHLADRIGDVPSEGNVTVMCGSGARATIAASVLLKHGRSDIDVFLGSTKAWLAADHPVVKP